MGAPFVRGGGACMEGRVWREGRRRVWGRTQDHGISGSAEGGASGHKSEYSQGYVREWRPDGDPLQGRSTQSSPQLTLKTSEWTVAASAPRK